MFFHFIVVQVQSAHVTMQLLRRLFSDLQVYLGVFDLLLDTPLDRGIDWSKLSTI